MIHLHPGIWLAIITIISFFLSGNYMMMRFASRKFGGEKLTEPTMSIMIQEIQERARIIFSWDKKRVNAILTRNDLIKEYNWVFMRVFYSPMLKIFNFGFWELPKFCTLNANSREDLKIVPCRSELEDYLELIELYSVNNPQNFQPVTANEEESEQKPEQKEL